LECAAAELMVDWKRHIDAILQGGGLNLRRERKTSS
jgi:hypothetical protein